MKDIIDIEILEDGTISVTTDKISDTNHCSADDFLTELSEMLGGTVVITPRKDKKAHKHTHEHAHAHNGKWHTH